MRPCPLFRIRLAALVALLACSSACRERAIPVAVQEAVPAASATSSSVSTPAISDSAPAISVSAGSAVAVSAAPERVEVPAFSLERFAPAGTQPRLLASIEGAVVVADKRRVGRIVGERIDWLPKKIPNRHADAEQFTDRGGRLGDTLVTEVHGRWPDRIDVVYVLENGRVAWPSYFPLTGEGREQSSGVSGTGEILGVVTAGESTLVAVEETMGPEHIETVRGPRLERRHLTQEEAGCKPGEVSEKDPPSPAIPYSKLVGTPEGTLLALGRLCEKRGPAAEVWDETASKPRLVDLSSFIKGGSSEEALLSSPPSVVSKGDELWVVVAGKVLHYQHGQLDALPGFGDTKLVFMSPSGQLHASDGRTIQRYADGRWTPIGRFAVAQPTLQSMALDEHTYWASTRDDSGTEKVYRLRERSPR